MMSKPGAVLYFTSVLLASCASMQDDWRVKRHLTDPEELFEVRESGDFGFFGLELRSDRVFPLNWIAKMHPEEKGETIYRISRTGGWSRDSFLIVPQEDSEGFVIDWHSFRVNPELGPKDGHGLPEKVVTSSYFRAPSMVGEIRRILGSELIRSPEEIRLPEGRESGDDSPFLLVERFGPDGYRGNLVEPDLYCDELYEEAEALLDDLTRLFVPVGEE